MLECFDLEIHRVVSNTLNSRAGSGHPFPMVVGGDHHNRAVRFVAFMELGQRRNWSLFFFSFTQVSCFLSCSFT